MSESLEKVVSSEGGLLTAVSRYPHLLTKLHPTKNDYACPSFDAKEKVWWLCSKCEYEWLSTVKNRSRGRGCPACAKKVVTATNCMAATHPHLADELHRTKNLGLTPFSIFAGTGKKLWWVCLTCKHEWQATGNSRASSGRGCPACSGHTTTHLNSLASKNPQLVREFHAAKNTNITPQTISYSSDRIIWWWCSRCTHEWKTSPSNRNAGAGCPACSGQAVTHSNSMDRTHPALSREFHPTKNGTLTSCDVVAGTHKVVWWLCSSCGHDWRATGYTRKSGRGCPACAGKVATSSNCLLATHPSLAKEWHPDKNGLLTPENILANTNKRIWWLCPQCSHEWHAAGNNRVSGKGCPACVNRAVSSGNCMTVTHPDLTLEFHPTKNDELTPYNVVAGTHTKLWWKCKECQHEWKSTGTNRVAGKGCPRCNISGGFNVAFPGVLYVLSGNTFGKVGISNKSKIEKRLRHHQKKGIYGPLVILHHFNDGADALRIETNLKRFIRTHYGNPTHLPEGNTEAFPIIKLPEIMAEVANEISYFLNLKNSV